MPRTWEQAFDFYTGMSSGRPVLVSVDLGAVDHVPLSSHTRLFRVHVTMNRPLENGLRSPEESDALFAIQDHLERTLGEELDAIYWGKVIVDGYTIFAFQVPAGEEDIEIPWAPPLAGYEVGTTIDDDPEWQAYRDDYPNEFQEHQMRNRQQQAALEEGGDSLRKRRRIDHLAFFPSEEARASARRPLKKARFRIGSAVEGVESDSAYGLEFHRTDRVDGREPDEVTAQILDCIEPFGGVYDGWGCAVTR